MLSYKKLETNTGIILYIGITFRLRHCNFYIYIDTTLCRKTFLKLSKACRTWNERFDVISISQRESENLCRSIAIWHGILLELALRKIGYWAFMRG